jgi:hypothetical protein
VDCPKGLNMYWKFSLRSESVPWMFLHMLETTHSDLGGLLPKPMNMCCYIEYIDLDPSFEHNSLSFSPNSKCNIPLKIPWQELSKNI